MDCTQNTGRQYATWELSVCRDWRGAQSAPLRHPAQYLLPGIPLRALSETSSRVGNPGTILYCRLLSVPTLVLLSFALVSYCALACFGRNASVFPRDLDPNQGPLQRNRRSV